MKWRHALALLAFAIGACSSAPPPQPPDLIASALASSVQLFTEREGGARRAGSGVVAAMASDGKAIVLTAAHLIEPLMAQEIYIKTSRKGDRLPQKCPALQE